jgi:adenylyltransferase/sulfurtransferase
VIQTKRKNSNNGLVIGAGGLGLFYNTFRPQGVGTIGIVDFDKIEIHNLHRQILYTENQVGLSKALIKEKLKH